MTGIQEYGSGIAQNERLIGDCPTIFNRASGLTFMVNEPDANATTMIKVYDVRGKLIKDLGSETGKREVAWAWKDETGQAVPAGVYFLRCGQGKVFATRKLILTD